MEEKNTRRFKLTLYRKEQLTLCIITLCFVLSAFLLPKYREQIAPVTAETDTAIAKNVNDTEVTEPIESPEPEDAVSDKETPEENTEETVEESTETTDNTSETSKSDDNKGTKEPTKDSSGKKKDPGKDSSDKKKEPAKDSSNKTEKPKQDSSSSKEETEKEWVPPVYKTVHHDAVYETKRIAVCNYCSEKFSTVGEFQIHKDANGG